MIEFLDKPAVILIVLLALVVFGSKRLPGAARDLGRSMRILKAETKGLHDETLNEVMPASGSAPVPALHTGVLHTGAPVAAPASNPPGPDAT